MISTFLKETAHEPFSWGQNDCALWSTKLFEQATGIDPAESLRGTYNSWFEARQIMQKHGGLENLCRMLMTDFEGGERMNGIAVARVHRHVFCGVLCRGRFFMKTMRGVVSPAKVTVIEGWGLCHKH